MPASLDPLPTAKSDAPVRAPVLFLVFNRPNTTAEVFAAIRAARPPRLYVAADGPRLGRLDDAGNCALAREAALAVDWPCEVHILMRDHNLGCRRAVEGALDWFFAAEEAGIVLEDDCLPVPGFFPFCEQLLAHYRDEVRVFSISGSSFQNDNRRGAASYYFSKHFHCWGWASWRRAWQDYRARSVPVPEALARGLARYADGSRWFAPYWRQIDCLSKEGRVDSWAYPVSLFCFARGGSAEILHAIPATNLIGNIGFDGADPHTRGNHPDSRFAMDLAFPVEHPSSLERDTVADRYTDRTHFGIAWLPYMRRQIAFRFPFLERFAQRIRGLFV